MKARPVRGQYICMRDEVSYETDNDQNPIKKSGMRKHPPSATVQNVLRGCFARSAFEPRVRNVLFWAFIRNGASSQHEWSYRERCRWDNVFSNANQSCYRCARKQYILNSERNNEYVMVLR